jgi:hypothetical protein
MADDDTRTPFREKLATLQFHQRGRTVPRVVERDGQRIVEKVHEDTGGMAGYETRHADGRVDQTITPTAPAVRLYGGDD